VPLDKAVPAGFGLKFGQHYDSLMQINANHTIGERLMAR